MLRFIRCSLLGAGLLLGSLVGSASAQTPPPTIPSNISFCPKTAVGRAYLGFVKALSSPDEKVRIKAAVEFAEYGGRVKQAAPIYVEMAINSSDRASVLRALAKIDADATRSAIRQILLIPGCKSRGARLDSLVQVGAPALPHLKALLADSAVSHDAEEVIARIQTRCRCVD